MTKLVIKFQSDNPTISVKINDHDCNNIGVTESEIIINHQLLFGFHKLAITVDTAIKILDVIVYDVSVKNTLFLWSEILKNVPDSKIFFNNYTYQDSRVIHFLYSLFEKNNINSEYEEICFRNLLKMRL